MVGDLRSSDSYLCALAGVNLEDPLTYYALVFAIWIAVVVGVSLGIRDYMKKQARGRA
jgi:hypothetical protein